MITTNNDLVLDGFDFDPSFLFHLVHEDGDYLLSASLPKGVTPGTALSIEISAGEEAPLTVTLHRDDVAKLRDALIQHWVDTSEEGFCQGVDATKLNSRVFECWSRNSDVKLRIERFNDRLINDGLAFCLGLMTSEDDVHYQLEPVRVVVAKMGLDDIKPIWHELRQWLEATAQAEAA